MVIPLRSGVSTLLLLKKLFKIIKTHSPLPTKRCISRLEEGSGKFLTTGNINNTDGVSTLSFKKAKVLVQAGARGRLNLRQKKIIMSTDLKIITGEKEVDGSNPVAYADQSVTITSFFGGNERGPMIQLTINDDYVQLTKRQVYEFIKTLNDWL